MSLSTGLNEEQQKAVTHTEGPLMIVAGAGTGKTTVITRRIAWLIDQGLAKPEQILALTFTDKAAGEMEERVDLLLPYGYVDLQISTFHAFCERLLRDHGVEVGLSPDFDVLTDLDAWLLMREHLDRFALDHYRPLGNPTKYLRALLQHFSRAKDNAVTPEQYLAFAEAEMAGQDQAQADQESAGIGASWQELAGAYQTYEQLLLEKDALDFGDLILYTLKLLRERPAVLEKVRDRFRYILVDEFQDTNPAQYELVRLIAQPRRNLTVVGDDDQSIYKFRGASIENILRFEQDYPDATRVVLSSNYRSVQAILDRAHELIKLNEPRRLPKKLASVREGEGAVEHLSFRTSEDEVRGVTAKILEIKASRPDTAWSDFAVLVRSNDAGADFAHGFDRERIPFQFLALSGLYHKSAVLDLLSLLRCVDQPHESPSLYRLLNFPTWNLSPFAIAELTLFATRKGKTLFEAMRLARTMTAMDPADAQIMDDILHLLTTLALSAKEKSAAQLFVDAARESGYFAYLNQLEEGKKREAFGYLQQLFERIKSFERRAAHRSLHAFLEEFRQERDAGEEGALLADLEAGPDVVRIMTIHGAKGLEFPYVFVVNLVDRKFPTSRRSDAIPLPKGLAPSRSDTDEALFHLEEERRLFYVAITRAKDRLFLTSAEDYGGARKRKASRFLEEVGFGKAREPQATGRGSWEDLPEKGSPMTPPNQENEPFVYADYLPKKFSFTQLAAFQTCPLQYKYAHILRVPVLDKWQFSFGKTMHNTLHRYFTAWMERTGKRQGGLFETEKTEQEMQNGALPVAIEELLEMYKNAWIDAWYPNDKTREEYRKRGKEQLIRYAATFAESPPQPVGLEQGFIYKVGDIVVKGRIDRIDACENGIEIIDYKTGSPKKTLEREDKEQLLLYQLAAKQVLKLEPRKLTYVYLENGSRVSFLGSDDDLLQLEEAIVDRVRRIRESDFGANPDFHCRHCDFNEICEYRGS